MLGRITIKTSGALSRPLIVALCRWDGCRVDVSIDRIHLRPAKLDEWCRCGPFRDAPFSVSWTELADDISL